MRSWPVASQDHPFNVGDAVLLAAVASELIVPSDPPTVALSPHDPFDYQQIRSRPEASQHHYPRTRMSASAYDQCIAVPKCGDH